MRKELESVKGLIKTFKDHDYKYTELQENLDILNINSSIHFGENQDEVISMEIWKDGHYYLELDNKYNIIKED